MANYPGFINRVCKRIARELQTLKILDSKNKVIEVLKQMKIRIALKDYILKKDIDFYVKRAFENQLFNCELLNDFWLKKEDFYPGEYNGTLTYCFQSLQ